jgi:hypothetical protein
MRNLFLIESLASGKCDQTNAPEQLAHYREDEFLVMHKKDYHCFPDML